MREIIHAVCSCGGEIKQVDQTPQEQKDYNCPRGCCGTALECVKCHVRFVIEFAAPEME